MDESLSRVCVVLCSYATGKHSAPGAYKMDSLRHHRNE